MKEETNKLVESIILQAKYFLNDAGEFFPFGTSIDINGNISPIGTYSGNEHPKPIEVLKELEQGMQQMIGKRQYTGVAIGIDVRTVPPGGQEKVDAIEIRVDHKREGSTNYYLPYEKLDNGTFIFYEMFSNKGTLNIFN